MIPKGLAYFYQQCYAQRLEASCLVAEWVNPSSKGLVLQIYEPTKKGRENKGKVKIKLTSLTRE